MVIAVTFSVANVGNPREPAGQKYCIFVYHSLDVKLNTQRDKRRDSLFIFSSYFLHFCRIKATQMSYFYKNKLLYDSFKKKAENMSRQEGSFVVF